MAVLVEGQKYGLSSKSEKSKSVVYVKLTDSSLRSLEDYLKHRAVFENSEGPTIQFNASGGEITLPTDPDGQRISYTFGASKIEDVGPNKQGSFDCLHSSPQGSLQSVGSMREKLHVQASDDVYQRIGQRIHDVKKEAERKTTVLLDNKSDKKKTGLSREPLVKRPLVPPPPPRTLDSGSAIAGSGASNGSWSGPGRGVPSPTRHVPLNTYHPQHKSQLQQDRDNFNTGKKCPPQKIIGNPEIMKRPLRERLIHLLAVRPYKKPELLVRISKDGLRDRDRKNITQELKSISFLKDNSYHLMRHIWNDVHEEWPFFSEEERHTLKRRKPQNLTPESDTGSTSSGHSPSSTNPASPPQITNSLKRHFNSYQEAQPKPKKTRVSHFKREPTGSSRLQLGWSERSPKGGLSPSNGLSPPDNRLGSPNMDLPDWGHHPYQSAGPVVGRSPVRHQPPPRRSPSLPPPDQPLADQSRSTTADHSSPRPQQQLGGSPTCNTNKETPESTSGGPDSSPDNGGSPQLQQPMPNSNKDFLTAYTTILSAEQRTRYKQEFNEHYANYRTFHNILDRVSKRFAQLENSLKQQPKDSPEFKKVQAEVMEEYAKNREDAVYQNARRQFKYLHEKLAHIKMLVHNYDTDGLR